MNVVDAPFVPEQVSLDQVDAAWERLAAANPRLHDGGLLHVLGISRNGHGGLSIHVAESSYRFHAVGALGLDTGIRPLGAKAIVVHRGMALMGRRSSRSGSYPGCWEFVPGGTLAPEEDADFTDTRQAVVRELREEAGIDAEVARVPALAVFLDTAARTWEVVHGFHLQDERLAAEVAPGGWEHEELRWVQPGCCPEPASPAAGIMEPLARSFADGA